MKRKLGGERVKTEGDPLKNVRWDALTYFLEVLDDKMSYVLAELRSEVLPRAKRYQGLVLDKSSDSEACEKAARDVSCHWGNWLARYHLDSPHVAEAIWASAPFLHSEGVPFPRSPMTAVLGYHPESEPLYARFVDWHGSPTETASMRTLDVCSERFNFSCSAFDPTRHSMAEWKNDAVRFFKNALAEHLMMRDTDDVRTPAVFSLDSFRWAALYLCGPRDGGEVFGWSDRQIAILESTPLVRRDKRLMSAAIDKVKKGRTKILRLLEIKPRPSLPRGRPRRK